MYQPDLAANEIGSPGGENPPVGYEVTALTVSSEASLYILAAKLFVHPGCEN